MEEVFEIGLVITSKVKNLKSIHNFSINALVAGTVGNYLESKKFEINSQQFVPSKFN